MSQPIIPDHDLIRRIGSGSYGEVWLGRSSLGTFRAIKIVYERTFRHTRPFEREFNGVQRFEPISRLHEGLVDVLQVGRNAAAGYFYCVMELADDVQSGQAINPDHYSPRTLAHDIARHKQLAPADCRRIGAAIASALEFLHCEGLIHRDIKPSNIVFVKGQPKLADIGLVAEMSEAKSYVGTEGFIPPEGPGTVQADIYSLGKVLYEISTGKDRHEYPDLPTHLGDPVQRTELMELNAIIVKACRNEPAQRYKSAEAMAEDLRTGCRRGRVKSRNAVRWGLAAGIAAAGITAFVAYKLNTPQSSPLPPRPPGLVAWWKGDGDGSDSAGNFAIEQLDGVGFGDGKVGQGFRFDGEPRRMTVSHAPALNFGAHQDFSIEAWIQPLRTETQYGLMAIVGKLLFPRDAEYVGYQLSLNHGKLAFGMSDVLERFSFVAASGGPDLRDGRFHHVAACIRRDSKTGGVLYVDGKKILTFDPTSKSGDLSTAEPLQLGYYPNPEYRAFFKGTIDEVSLYNRALSAEEIQAIYNSGSAGKDNPNLSSSTFERPIDLASGGGPVQPVVVDLDGDGRLDIAVANAYAHTISLYRNVDSGGAVGVDSFDLPVKMPAGNGRGPYLAVATDMDGDGKPDLIAGDYRTNQVAVFRNVSRPGTLSFAAPVFFDTGERPVSFVVKDLDGDGRPDIAVVNLCDTVSLLRNLSVPGELHPESFAAKVDLVVGAPRHDLRIDRDLDGDGVLDIIPGAYPVGVVAGDFDGDGRPDLAIVNFYGTNISIFQNVGSPGKLDASSFARGPALPATEHNRGLILGDIDGDGKADLLAGSSNRLVSVYRNLARPGALSLDSFAPRVEILTGGWVNNIVLGDLNRDGKPELIVYTQIPDHFSVFQNFSVPGGFTAASLGPRLDFPTGNNPSGLSVADIDGDGWPDCVSANMYSGTISIRRNAGLRRGR